MKGKIQDGSRLSVVSAYFTIYAYDALKDILVNNASAISLTDTEHTPMKRYDPMNGINARGNYLRTQACLP